MGDNIVISVGKFVFHSEEFQRMLCLLSYQNGMYNSVPGERRKGTACIYRQAHARNNSASKLGSLVSV